MLGPSWLSRGLLAAALPVVLVALAAPVLLLPGGGPEAQAGITPVAATAARDKGRPDIVFVLMDDFSLELLATMPTAQTMVAEGASYDNAFVVDSLCCPSRASIFTGRAPHQTHVLTNTPNDYANPIGGFEAFVRYGNLHKTFNLRLERHGYTTGFIGKYMNRYEATNRNGTMIAPGRVPGWSEFQAILGGGYNGWGFLSTRLTGHGVALDEHPRPTHLDGATDQAYATNVAADKAVDFIERHRGDRAPYFLEVAVYAPHAELSPAYPGQPLFPSALADRAPADDPAGGNCGLTACDRLTLRDLKGYGDPRRDNAPTYLGRSGRTRPAPPWRTNDVLLSDEQALTQYRDRARMVQSVDRMLARIRRTVGPDTYIVLTSDNGFHLGQHMLNGGKGTPYDSDTRVPLVVTGPGVVPGPRAQFVNNIDLASTFEQLAGLRPASFRSGTGFARSLRHPDARGGRFAFFEHTYAKSTPGEVDLDMGSSGTIDIIPSYIAVRGERGLLVRFDLDNSWRRHRYAWELYRYDQPWEDVNVFASDHATPWARDLMRRLVRWDGCTPARCRAAAR